MKRNTKGGGAGVAVRIAVVLALALAATVHAQPALVSAAVSGDAAGVAAALKAGAAADTVDEAGITALAHSVYNGHGEVVSLLLSAGASPYRTDSRGRSPWMWAAYLGKTGIVRKFLDAGVDVNAAPAGGPTALMLAALAGHGEVVTLLLRSGADAARRDGDGNTAEAWARDRGFDEIVRLLRAPQPAESNWPVSLGTAAGAAYLGDVEKAVVLELNRVRTNPSRYAELYIAPMAALFRGDLLVYPGETAIRTNEGVAAVEECVRVLSRAAAVGPLSPRPGLSAAAGDHVRDQGPTGAVGHGDPGARIRRHGESPSTWGENISYGYGDARRIVISLLVDDGVPGRGHRDNIMNGRFDSIGVAVGPHSGYGAMCVMDFAK